MLSDETRVGLVLDDRRVHVWRVPGRQSRATKYREVVPFQDGSAMFSGGIMWNDRTPLTLIPGNMTRQTTTRLPIARNGLILRKPKYGQFTVATEVSRFKSARTCRGHVEKKSSRTK